MSKLVIKKRVSFDFLGEEFKDAYIIFRSIPLGDYDELMAKMRSGEEDNSKANSIILDVLKEYYIEGMFPDDAGKLETLDNKDELNGLDRDAVLRCFGDLIGQDVLGAAEQKAKMAAEGAPAEQIETVTNGPDPKS